LDFLDRVECVAELLVGPRFVDEILARVAGRCRVSSALASRDHVVPTCGHPSLTKCASCGHTTGRSDIPPEAYPFGNRSASFVWKLRTPGWSLPPAHTQRFLNLHH
jgi:hypothetical protein